MKFFRKNLESKKSFILIEILISVVILAISLGSVVYFLSNMKKLSIEAKNRTIAINIAREGMESVRNIRDTNWEYFSSEKRKYWNRTGEYNNDVRNTAKVIEHKNCYILKKNENNGAWFLSNEKAWDDVNDVNTDFETDDSRKIYIDEEDGFFTDIATDNEETFFRREICFDYLDDSETVCNDNADCENKNYLRVTVFVNWPHVAGRNEKIKLVTILSDFLARSKK